MMWKWAPEADLVVYAQFRNYLISEACENDEKWDSEADLGVHTPFRNYLISEAGQNDVERGSRRGFSGIRPVAE